MFDIKLLGRRSLTQVAASTVDGPDTEQRAIVSSGKDMSSGSGWLSSSPLTRCTGIPPCLFSGLDLD